MWTRHVLSDRSCPPIADLLETHSCPVVERSECPSCHVQFPQCSFGCLYLTLFADAGQEGGLGETGPADNGALNMLRDTEREASPHGAAPYTMVRQPGQQPGKQQQVICLPVMISSFRHGCLVTHRLAMVNTLNSPIGFVSLNCFHAYVLRCHTTIILYRDSTEQWQSCLQSGYCLQLPWLFDKTMK